MRPFYQPTVKKVWLFWIAGAMWSGVGLMLCSLAYGWLAEMHSSAGVWIGLSGALLALIAYRYGFSKIARKNIDRLHSLLERANLFHFMPLKSYLLVAVMMALGMALRHSPLPRPCLAEVYATIGGALFLSSIHYYRSIWKMVKE